MNPPPFSNGENPHTYPDCHVYEPEDYAADFEAAAASSLRGPGGSGSRSVQPYELWCPFAVRKLAMPTQGEYALGYPQGAVIHATEGWSLNGDTDLENTIAYGITQKHAYFGISRTGTIYQTHPLSEWGHHAGATRHALLGSGLSAKLVGIELASAGLVQPEGAGFRALGWPERFTAEQVRHAKAEGNVTRAGHYLAYTPEQEASLTKLLLWLHHNNPDVFKLEHVLGHDEIAVDRQGRLGRKQDPGGGLSMTMEDYRCHLAGGTPTRGGLAPSPDPAPRELCWETAFLLASASKLAYRPEEVIRETLSKSSWGFLKVDFLSEADTQVIVASDASRVLVAYRGSKELGDWLGNLEFLQQEQLTLGRVHRGFSQAFAVVREALFTTLTDHDPESRKELWLTGHSLGGALALLTAAELPNPGRITGIYTFGQPRAGLTDFQTKIDEVFVGRYFRFVNFDDVVPRIPPGDYVHAGHLIWFNAKGEPDTAPPEQTRSPIPAAAQYSEAEFLHFKAFLESARQHATRSDPAEPEEEGLELFRGEMPGGFNNHRIDRYIEFVHRQKPALAALEVRGRPASAPIVPPPAAAVTVEVPPPAPSPALVSPPANLNAFLKPQPLLPLAVHVTWSPTSHQLGLCQETAKAIFEFLNHPVARPASADDDELNPDLESGAGIPVFVGHHCERIRESVEKRLVTGPPQNKATIVFLLLDEQTAHERQQGTPFGSLLNYLFDPNRITSFGTNVLVVPVCLHASAKGSLPEGLSPLTAAETPDQPAEAIARQAALTTANFLMRRRPGAGSEAPAPVKLLLSYSHSDIDITGTLATQLSEGLSHSFGQFFASENLPTPDSHRIPKGRIEGDTVILIIRSDSYTSSPGTLRDVLDAKKSGMPIVTLNVLREGRGRSFSCEGNSITLAWNPTTPRGETPKPVEFSDLVSRCIKVCLRAWLHHLHFHLLPEAVFELRGLDWKKDLITPISRPPELLDLVQGPLSDVGSGVIFYPDPPLSSSESRILRRAQPKVRLATPTSLSNEVWRRIPCPPLSGMQIALSLSISPDLAPDFPHISPEFKGSFSNGVLVPHMDAAVAYLSLSLIRSGATLGFGGTVRERSYASFLSGLVDVYNQTAPTGKSLLRSFRRASSSGPESNEEGSNTQTVHCEAVPTQPPVDASVQGALDLTQMRRRMAQDCHVRILMGGRTKPKLKDQDDGYHGRFPGQAEEAFHFLSAGKPIYVSGGFWGVSGHVAKALCNELGDLPRETEWLQESRYAELCQGYDAARPSDWNLPATLDDLWKAFAEFGKGFFWGPGSEDPQKPWTNGLTVAENRALFSAVQPDHISALVTKGLEKVASQSQGKDNRPPLNIALFNGSFIDVPDTEAYAVIMLKGARLRGADAALNEKLPGLLQKSLGSQASDRAQALPITSDELTGDFVLLQWMKPLKPTDSETELKARVRQALDAFIDCARDYRIASLSIVPIGVNLGLTPEDSADLILDAFLNQTADGIQNIALCEIDTGRYDKIKERVLNRVDQAGGNLSCSELEPQIPTNLRVPLFLDFSQLPNKNRKGPQVIQQFARGTGGGGVVPKDSKTIDWSKLKDAFDANSGLPPNFAKHGEIGMELTNWVLSESVRQCVQENRSNPWEILHDLSCSDIPFEMLAFKDKDGTVSHPALHVGFCRRLASENADPVSNFAAKGCYRLLLVANPTDDLKATLKEAEQIQEELGSITLPRFEIKSLIGSRQATLSKVLDEIGTGRYDLIHYAGHGHFDSNPKKSGLKFKQGFLTAQELRDTILRRRKERRQTAARAGTTDPGRPPMLVFLNACLSSKMIGSGDTQARVQASLAEAVLEAGVAGLIGNRWQVQDNSAATFAIKIYRALTSRIALGEAIRQARQTLHSSGQPDWANYQFYGSREVII